MDAIVSSSGCDLQLNRGSISGALLRSGGRTLLDECSSKAPSGIHLGEVVVTSGGQLQCKFVIHGACCSWADGPDNCKQVSTETLDEIDAQIIFVKKCCLFLSIVCT